MEHEHIIHTPGNRRVMRGGVLISIILTGSMMIVEIVGGYLTNSLALISDGAHMFTHLFALLMSYTAIILAIKPHTKVRSFGLYRVEILVAFINGITLLIVTVFLFTEAYHRIISIKKIFVWEMLTVASAGLGVNLLTAMILWKHTHDINIKSAFIHVIGDTISSIGIISGAIVIYFTNWWVIDPIIAMGIAILISIWALRLLIDSSHILLESTPKDIDVDEIVTKIKENKKIVDIHDVHIWEITSKMYYMTAHIVIGDCMLSECNHIAEDLNKILRENYHIVHTNFQFESLKN